MIRDEINRVTATSTTTSSELENILKCNSTILKILMGNDIRSTPDEVREIISNKIFVQKLKFLLGYYRPRGPEDGSILDKRYILKNKFPISDCVKKIITESADNLNLNLEQTIDLVDLFFQNNIELLESLQNKEKFIKVLEKDTSTERHFSESKIIEFRHRYRNMIQNIQDQVSSFYYDERSNLLKLFHLIIKISDNPDDPISRVIRDIYLDLNKNNELFQTVWEIFKMYTHDYRITKDLVEISNRDKHGIQILKEQVHILDILMRMCKSIDTTGNFKDTFMDMLETFSKQNFMGYYFEIVNEPHIEENRHELNKITLVIMDLCVLLILNNLDIKYFFYYDNKIHISHSQEVEIDKIDPSRMPFSIFKSKAYIDKILKFFDDKFSQPYPKPLFMAFYSIIEFLNSNTINDNEIVNNIKSISKERISDLEDKCNRDYPLEFFNDMYNRQIFSQERNESREYYQFIIKFWLNVVLKYYFKYYYDKTFIELCVKTLDSDMIKYLFWTIDRQNNTPLNILFENLIDDFPNNFDLMLMFCKAVKGTKNAKYLSDNIFFRLNEMKLVNITCVEDEFDHYDDEDMKKVRLTNGKKLRNGMTLPEGTFGEVLGLQENFKGNQIKYVRFDYNFSIFSTIYSNWNSLIDALYDVPSMGLISLNDLIKNTEDKNNINFIQLFCYLIADNNSHLYTFFNSLVDTKYMTDNFIHQGLHILLSYSFETISLLTKNWQLYAYLLPLSNAIYSMIESFLKNPKINNDLIHVIINHFMNSFEGLSRTSERDQYSFSYSLQPNMYQKKSADLYNLVEIFGNTIKFDFNRKNFENSIIVLKIIKNFFKYPNILEFVKNLNSADFLYNLWFTLVAELVKFLINSDTLNSLEEFLLFTEITKIIYYNFRVISLNNPLKSTIISTNPNAQNMLHELIINCLNSVETSEFILKILRTKVILDGSEVFTKDKIVLRNIFWDNFKMHSMNYIEKNKAKNLIRIAFKCLNQIFDIVYFYRTTTDENNKKLLSRIETIKLWQDVFFISKSIPVFDSRWLMTGENYSINLIMSIFSYIDFENKEMLEYEVTRYDANLIRKDDQDQNIKSNENLSYEDLIHYQKVSEKDLNICTLSLNTLVRMLGLVKISSSAKREPGTKAAAVKSSNLLNYLNIKKETASELDGNISFLDKIKFTICHILIKPFDNSYKIEIIKFLIQCANSQIGFLMNLLEDSKIKILKSNKFWEIFGILISEKPTDKYKNRIKQYKELVGYSTLFMATIFSSDAVFKKMIKEFIYNYKNPFEKFINSAIEMFNLSQMDTRLLNCREILKNTVHELKGEEKLLLFAEDDFSLVAFENLVNKSISIIFARLILISEDIEHEQNFSLNSPKKQFSYNKELLNFLNINVSNFLDYYNTKLNYEFVYRFNNTLADPNSFVQLEDMRIKDDNRRIFTSGSGRYLYSELNVKENIININNIEKIIQYNSEDENLDFYIPYFNSTSCSINHWIDLKELLITMKLKNYNLDILVDNLNSFISYNLELSLLEAKVNTMQSISYLIGLIFSIGKGNSFLSTFLFTGFSTFKAINSCDFSKEFALYYLDTFKSEYPFIGFKFTSYYSINDFIKFAEDKIMKKLQLDLNYCSSKGNEIIKDRMGVGNAYNSNVEFNFYHQYVSYKYNILNYLVDYVLYLYHDDISTSTSSNSSFPVSIFQKHFIRFLNEIERDFPLFINNINNIEIERCILSIINLIYSLLTYLIISEYKFDENSIVSLNNIINALLICFDKVPSYQAIIIFILNAYSGINYFTSTLSSNNQFESLNLLFNNDDNRIIRALLKKLSVKLTEQEYLAIVTLLITLVNNYEETLELIIKEKILLVFQLNDKFTNSIQIAEYQDNERAVNHILWCWTLIFLRQVCIKLIDIQDNPNSNEMDLEYEFVEKKDHMRYYSIYNSIVEYLINHESRILHVLSNTEYIDQSGNHMHKSLAYLEELEYITSLLNVLFMQGKRWKNSSQMHLDFHNRFVAVILSRTLKLYLPNIKISNHYKFFSNVERIMNDTFPADTKISADSKVKIKPEYDRHYTSFYSPMKKNIRGEKVDKTNQYTNQPVLISPRREFSRENANYNIKSSSLFFYRVDNCLNKILFNLTIVAKSAITLESFSNKNSYANYIREIYSRGPSSYGSKINVKVFDDQCQNLIYAVYFAFHSLESMIRNFDVIQKLFEMSNIFFGNINSSVNFGNLNLIYTEGHFEDIFQTNNSTIQNLLIINSIFYQFIYYFRSTLSYSFDNQLKEITLRKLDPIIKLMKERDNKLEGFKENTVVYDSLVDYVKRNMD